MIIVEGSDLVGKTTFCRELVKAINFSPRRFTDSRVPPHVHSAHLSAPPSTWNFVNDYCTNRRANEVTVWDRYHISELMYREFHTDPKPKLGAMEYIKVDGVLANLSALIVIITADNEMLTNRVLSVERDEMFPQDVILAVNAAYQRFDRSHATPHPFVTLTTCEMVHIHCDAEKPFPDGADIAAVANKFLNRWMP